MLLAGAAAGWVGFTWELPPAIHLPLAILAGLVAGAVWGGLAGLLKARTGAHEVIVTIMLNYVAYYLVLYALSRQFLLQAPGSANPKSAAINDSAILPKVLGDRFNLHYGFLLALAAVAVVWWLINRSTLGYRIRAVGLNPSAARKPSPTPRPARISGAANFRVSVSGRICVSKVSARLLKTAPRNIEE
jgi:simple sugar transport system permease protein